MTLPEILKEFDEKFGSGDASGDFPGSSIKSLITKAYIGGLEEAKGMIEQAKYGEGMTFIKNSIDSKIKELTTTK